MTIQTKNQLKALAWTVVAGILLLLAPKAANQLVYRAEFESHIRQANVVDSLLLDASYEILCELKPNLRKCQ